MLRVGLTGELGSGKSTVLRMFATLGAVVMSSDEMGRAMMQPGQPVYEAIVRQFGPSVVLPDGTLDRPALARLAFDPEHPRVEELNAIVHPAVIEEQERRLTEIARTQPDAIVVIESALIFTTRHGTTRHGTTGHGGEEPWRRRFDCILVVTAPDEAKIARFVQRSGSTREDAVRRLAAQRMELPGDTITIWNDGSLDLLERSVCQLWDRLVADGTCQ